MDKSTYSGTLLNNLSNYFIYASVLLGIVLLVQLYNLVPAWLFLSVFTGWTAYLVDAILVLKGYKHAYPLALILALLTLAVSLPQPEHYMLLGQEFSPAALTFLAGSIIQIGVIITVTSRMLLDWRGVRQGRW